MELPVVVNVVVAVVVDCPVLDVEQLRLEEVHGPGLVHALLLLHFRPLIVDLLLTSPLFLLFRDDLRAPLLPTEEHLVALELRPEERDRRGGGVEVAHGAGVVGVVEALGAADSPPAELAVDDALHDLSEMSEVIQLIVTRKYSAYQLI